MKYNVMAFLFTIIVLLIIFGICYSISKINNSQEIFENNLKLNNLIENIRILEDNAIHLSALNKELTLQNTDLIKQKDSYTANLEEIQKEKEKADNELQTVKDLISAGVQVNLREQEKEDNIKFYTLSVDDREKRDIEKLEKVKLSLYNPEILSKLIWTQFFQKQTAELRNRVFGGATVCGIYKITNILTKQVYIGQSNNIQDRITAHIKCGLGIGASATNRLYNAMQKDGIWNFSFELLEKCERSQLNIREAYWIELYKSDKIGYNSTKGNYVK